MTSASPATVRLAAALVGLQGALAVLGAVVFVIRGIGGPDSPVVSGFANAVWFVVFGAALLTSAWALWTGRRWGRGIAVFAQMLLLPVCWYLGVGSHRWVYALPAALVCLTILALLLFAKATVQWLTYDENDPASA
ncbi:hypothetical protein [Mycolicibacterium sp.]|jgi:hypothetical protein|uniref:hypothetical protein n=1 Tax=Mycolicibacterium sp. TaxID=2320850 RepID=UPI0028A5E3EE|nr:hypothetical protein [Mycolicibacterium sp.]